MFLPFSHTLVFILISFLARYLLFPCQYTYVGEVELAFANAGFAVFSNARNYRYDETVPILIPHANPEHIQIIPHQQKVKGYKGYIITNANCSSTGLVVALKVTTHTNMHIGMGKKFID